MDGQGHSGSESANAKASYLSAQTRIEWSQQATQDLTRLHDFLIKKNPRAAVEAITAVREATLHLEQFPASGRMTEANDPRQREWLVPYSNAGYVVRYDIEDGKVVIAAVRHSREAGL